MKQNLKIAAILPAYNEGKRIESVLQVLTQCKYFHEVIVINDGSTDNTEAIIKKFPVLYLKNESNKGKGYSLKKAVSYTTADLFFFCDADLKGLSLQIIEDILKPVLENKYDMFIGLRFNKMQRLSKFFALLSGERAFKRYLWDQLPDFYKNKFRIETGLNMHAQYYGKGYGSKIFENYFQTLKEVKYGFIRGFFRRLKMYLDVFIAYLYFQLFYMPRSIKLLRQHIVGLVLSFGIIVFSGLFLLRITNYGYRLILYLFNYKFVGEFYSFGVSLLFSLLRYFRLHTLVIVGYVLLVLGAIFLIWNILRIFKLRKM